MNIWDQKSIQLSARPRGFHLITHEISTALAEMEQVGTGMMFLHLQHTSASLTINENADPCVRSDLERYFTRTVDSLSNSFEHVDEGSDDMPAHVKSSLLGAQLTIPIKAGRLGLGIWQGVYLGEHRDAASPRTILITVQGVK